MKLAFNHEKMQQLRILQGMSTKDLAKRIGCTDRAITRWERGECPPRPKYVRRMASVFHVAQKELYVLTEEGVREYGNATAD